MADRSRKGPPAVIINSGSTNSSGFRITVYESGTVEQTRWPWRASAAPTDATPAAAASVVPGGLATRFFGDLRNALPFTQYEDRGCPKSASFGFTLRIAYEDEQSPDLACPVSDPRLVALVQDIREIEQVVSRTPSAG